MATRDRESLRRTFGSAAELYDAARPQYPDELLDTLTEVARLAEGSRVLEVGCGTGQATLPLARRGMHVTALELSPELAKVAARNSARFPNVRVEAANFETWHAGVEELDAIVSATAWHWIDPALRYELAWQLLRPSGYLGVWSATHVFPAGGDSFFAEIQAVYNEIGEGRPGEPTPRPGELPTLEREIAASGRFDVVLVKQFAWEIAYDADEYVDLLNTFSGHIAMDEAKRTYLYSEIRKRIATRTDGQIRRGWGAVLHVAQRRGAAADPLGMRRS
jgi:SAM-dependent methyltransferase